MIRYKILSLLFSALLILAGCFDDEDNPTRPSKVIDADILAPAANSVFGLGETITFIGSAEGPEEYSDSCFAWRSILDGSIGVGDTVTADWLSVGSHLIELAVSDSSGRSDSAVRGIVVEFRPTLENIWPNADSTMWRYRLNQRIYDTSGLDDPFYYQNREDVPDIPDMAEIEQMLRMEFQDDPQSEEEAIFRLQFKGEITTDSRVTAQNLDEIIIMELPIAGDLPAGSVFLSRLCLARPDLADRIISEYPGIQLETDRITRYRFGRSGDGIPRDIALILGRPLILHGGAWEKTDQWIGTYGDLDQLLAWKYLESNLSVGHQFLHQLVPSLTDDAFLHCRVLRSLEISTEAGDYEEALECLYVVDYGIWQAKDIGGNVIGYTRALDYGVIIYAPGAGPVYSHERWGVVPPFQIEPSSIGAGSMTLELIDTNVDSRN